MQNLEKLNAITQLPVAGALDVEVAVSPEWLEPTMSTSWLSVWISLLVGELTICLKKSLRLFALLSSSWIRCTCEGGPPGGGGGGARPLGPIQLIPQLSNSSR